jgi:hypothetical protein
MRRVNIDYAREDALLHTQLSADNSMDAVLRSAFYLQATLWSVAAEI